MDIQMEECSFCLTHFDLDDHKPYILSCGHSICKTYIDQSFSEENKSIKCPLENMDINYKRKEDIKKNFYALNLIKIIKEYKEKDQKRIKEEMKQLPQSDLATEFIADIDQ